MKLWNKIKAWFKLQNEILIYAKFGEFGWREYIKNRNS